MAIPLFPTGTRAIFCQTTAPVGWTKITTYDDYAIRITGGVAGTGGTVAFSSAFTGKWQGSGNTTLPATGSTTLSLTQLAAHTHSYPAVTNSGVVDAAKGNGNGPIMAQKPSATRYTGYVGGGGSHNHTISNASISFTGSESFAVKYVDVIIASKNLSLAPPQTFTVVESSSTMFEGDSVTVTINTENVASGSTLYWKLASNSTATAGDFTGASSGSVNILNKTASLTLEAAVDYSAEPAEVFMVMFYKDALYTDFVASSQTITVYDQPNIVAGQQSFTTAGTYTWTAPNQVSSISVVAIGGGGGASAQNQGAGAGGGGELRWKNNIPVVPGQTYTVVVGAGGVAIDFYHATDGGASSFNGTTVVANGGKAFLATTGGAGGSGGIGDGGGDGGRGGDGGGSNNRMGGGGGAGGYTGTGGRGGDGVATNTTNATDGSGGGGGGAIGGSLAYNGVNVRGAGTALGGQGANGLRTESFVFNAQPTVGSAKSPDFTVGYGGGGSGFSVAPPWNTDSINYGAAGAVRIIWGPNRFFPNTNTTNV